MAWKELRVLVTVLHYRPIEEEERKMLVAGLLEIVCELFPMAAVEAVEVEAEIEND